MVASESCEDAMSNEACGRLGRQELWVRVLDDAVAGESSFEAGRTIMRETWSPGLAIPNAMCGVFRECARVL